MERSDFYVYAYLEPDTLIPFYIGRGTGYRDVSHCYPSFRRRSSLFYNKLNRFLESGRRPIVRRLVSGLTHAEASFLEQFFILSIGRRKDSNNIGPLCNLTDGGEGNKGYKATEATRKKNAERARGNTNRRGKKAGDETRRKIKLARAKQIITEAHKAAISSANTGRTHSDSAREKIRLAATGRRHTRDVIRRMSASKCRPLIIGGVQYQSGKDAAVSLGVSPSTIFKLRHKAA